MTTFGVHTGLQNISMGELRSSWRRIEDLGFDWISIWDHFYAANGTDDPECHEAVATHTALACTTERVRCGSLVYCVGYRHPAILAKAICAIDHISGGRADIGLGAGWSKVEYDAYGIPFESTKERLDRLEEAAACVRSLLRNETTDFEGRYYTLTNAQCVPRPVQRNLPLWIGGGGEKRTLKIVAQYADGWNVPFIPPDQFAAKREVLGEHCSAIGRDLGEIRCSVNVGLAWTEDSLQAQFGKLANYVRPAALTGSDAQATDLISRYVEAGADQINIALRAPFDLDSLERFAAAQGLVGR